MCYTVIKNPVTGERVIPRIAPTEDNGWWAVSDRYAPPGARVVAAHVHPNSSEIFTVVRGHITVRLDEHTSTAGPGTRIEVPPGTPHDWWNAGNETVWIIVEASPGQRFAELTRNLFFLVAAGMTDRAGRPGLLQTAACRAAGPVRRAGTAGPMAGLPQLVPRVRPARRQHRR